MNSADVPSPGRPPLGAALFVAALGFLLASFPARNADLLKSLASGERIARGEATLDGDPRAVPDVNLVRVPGVIEGRAFRAAARRVCSGNEAGRARANAASVASCRRAKHCRRSRSNSLPRR